VVVLRGLGQAHGSLGPMGSVLFVCLPLAAVGLVLAG
jgi:hypothetical protein